MERDELLKRMTSIFRKTFNNNSLIIANELTAEDVDGWDSLSHMILISEIEKEFDIKFKLKELNKMKNIGVLIELVEAKS